MTLRNKPLIRNLLEALYDLICFLTYFSGIYAIVSFLKRKEPIILLYHSINNKQCNTIYPDNIIDPQNFEKQMIFLSTQKNLISLYDLFDYLSGSKNLPDNAVAVTFDDGYYDFYSNTYSILQRYNVPCTIFLITKLLNGEVKWDDYMTMMVFNTKSRTLNFKFTGEIFDLSSASKKLSCIRNLNDLLVNVEEQKKAEYLRDWESQLGKPIKPTIPLYLSWKEVKSMHYNDHLSFGSHSYNHKDLTGLPKNDIEYEILASKEALERNINKPCRLFSYPYGRYFNNTIKDVLMKSGFQIAVTTLPGRISRDSDPLELKRITVYGGKMFKFKCAMIGLTYTIPRRQFHGRK